MADRWASHEKAVDKLMSDAKTFNSKALKGHLDDFEKSYKKCRELEDKLANAAGKARGNGVTGGTLKDFKKDSGFYDIYKALDREADELAKAQKAAWIGSNYARSALNDVKTLADRINTEFAKLKKELAEAQEARKKNEAAAKSGKATLSPSLLKELQSLEKEVKDGQNRAGKLEDALDALKKDLAEAGSLYKKAVDQRMENYLDKFERMVEKIIDIPSDDGNKTDEKAKALPKELQASDFGVKIKKALMLRKSIDKHLKVAAIKLEKHPDFAKADLRAAKADAEALSKLALYFKRLLALMKGHFEKAENGSVLRRQANEVMASSEEAEKKVEEFEGDLKKAKEG